MMDPYEFERKLVHEEIMSSGGITGNKLKKEDVMETLIDIPADRSYLKILDYEIRGHGDLEEFLKDLKECKDAQHRWNELRDWLDDRINCVVSVDGVLMKMNELEKGDDDGR